MVLCKAVSCYNESISETSNPPFILSILTFGLINSSWEEINKPWCSYHRECLGKLFELENFGNEIGILFKIHEMDTFETWFNKNCGYLVIERNSDNPSGRFCYIYIVVYEPKKGEKSEIIKAIRYHTYYSGGSGGAIDKARELKRKLQDDSWEDNPILHLYDCANVYKFFSNIVTSPYVTSYSIGTYNSSSNIFYWEAWGSDHSNWDGHVRPLDIIKVEKSYLSVGFNHVGVYLGNNKVCHIYDYWNESSMKTRVDDVSVFLGDTSSTTRSGRVYVYHPIIPFKHYSKIARQVACVEENEYRKGNYDLANRNCEHLANMLVYGINFSEQVERNEGWFVASNFKSAIFGGLFSLLWREYSINNGKTTLKLTNEISESNSKLGYSRFDHWRTKEIERNYLQEVPPKETCRIM